MSGTRGRALVVVAHPLEDSLCAHLADTAVAALERSGRPVTVLDLYRRDFDPRLSAGERRSYGGDFRTELPEEMVEALRQAEVIVLAFPTWWFGLPAILKGFIDRAFAPGIAFDHAPDLGTIRPRLDGLRHLAIVTTLGTPWWADRLVMFRPVFRVMRLGVVAPCAPKARVSYHPLYLAENAGRERVARHAERLAGILSRL